MDNISLHLEKLLNKDYKFTLGKREAKNWILFCHFCLKISHWTEEQKLVGSIESTLQVVMWERKLYKALISSLKVPDSRAQTHYREHMWYPGGKIGRLVLQPLLLLLLLFHPLLYSGLEETLECVILARSALSKKQLFIWHFNTRFYAIVNIQCISTRSYNLINRGSWVFRQLDKEILFMCKYVCLQERKHNPFLNRCLSNV